MRTRFLEIEGRCLSFAVLVLVGIASEASSAPASQPAPKTFKFSMDKQPWRAVFAWLTEETGKPFVTTYSPTGTFTFHGAPDKEYTIPEIIDILNRSLRSNNRLQPYELIQRARCFTLVPADEEIDPALLPRVRLADLAQHGETELVVLVLPLKRLDAEKMALVTRVMLLPNGKVAPFSKGGTNSLILIGRVAKLKGISQFLMLLDKIDLFQR